jgi:hypothetical protein
LFADYRKHGFQLERDFYTSKVEACTDQKELFRTINNVMKRKTDSPLPDHDSSKQLANDFGHFFLDKINKIQQNFDSDHGDPFQNDTLFNGDKMCNFTLVSLDELRSIILKSKTKTCELDPLPTQIVKECLEELLPILQRIVNLSITEGRVPDVFKNAIVRPLLKKPHLDKIASNYRPVSNLCFVSKVIEQVVNLQLSEHLAKNSLCEELQSAYRPHCSTETALLKIFDDALISMDNRQAVFVTLLDLSAAFDTVDHDTLLRRLKCSFGIGSTALRWFSSYLKGRTMQVIIHETVSELFELHCSVPQGSILGPRLYTQYTQFVGLLARIVLLCYHGYADDTQLLKAFSPKSQAETQASKGIVEEGIRSISDALCNNKLKLNKNKTEFLILVSSYYERFINVDSLDFGEDEVARVSSAKNLGVVMDTTLSLEQQINSVRSNCFYYLNWIKNVRPFLTQNAAKILVHSLVISRIDYCNSLYINLPKFLIKKLQGVMNYAARIVTRCPRDASISAACKSLHWLPVEQRIIFKVAVLVYKCLDNSAPSYLTELLTPKVGGITRSSKDNLLVVPRSNLKYGERAFRVAGPSVWNGLPKSLRHITSLIVFKKELKTHLFRQAYYNVD